MKKPISTPVIISVVALAIVVLVFFMARNVSGPAEFAAPKVEKTIPRYVFDKMPVSTQEKMRKEGYTVTDAPPPVSSGPPK